MTLPLDTLDGVLAPKGFRAEPGLDRFRAEQVQLACELAPDHALRFHGYWYRKDDVPFYMVHIAEGIDDQGRREPVLVIGVDGLSNEEFSVSVAANKTIRSGPLASQLSHYASLDDRHFATNLSGLGPAPLLAVSAAVHALQQLEGFRVAISGRQITAVTIGAIDSVCVERGLHAITELYAALVDAKLTVTMGWGKERPQQSVQPAIDMLALHYAASGYAIRPLKQTRRLLDDGELMVTTAKLLDAQGQARHLAHFTHRRGHMEDVYSRLASIGTLIGTRPIGEQLTDSFLMRHTVGTGRAHKAVPLTVPELEPALKALEGYSFMLDREVMIAKVSDTPPDLQDGERRLTSFVNALREHRLLQRLEVLE